MKYIRLYLDASEDANIIPINTDEIMSDYGIDGTWETLTEEEKEEILQRYADNLPEQPYWIVNKFVEID